MICPKCRTLVSDDAVICDSCNSILDASFLGDDITNDDPPAEDATRIKQVDAEATRVKALPPEPPPRKRPAAGPAVELRPKRPTLAETAAPPPETAEALDDLFRQFKGMPLSDRLTAGGALALLASLALPWRSTRTAGDIIGLVAGGWPIALMALLVAVAVFLRRHPKLRPHRDHVLLGSALLATFCLLAAVVFWRTAQVDQVLKAGGRLVTHTLEQAQFGVYAGIVSAAVMFLGSVKGYLEREKLAD